MAVLRDTFVREFRKGERRPGAIDRDQVAGRPARPDVEVFRRCFPFFDVERLFPDHVRERGLAGGGGEGLRSRVEELLDREA